MDALAAVTAAAEWNDTVQPSVIKEIHSEGFTALWPNPVDDILYLDVADGTLIAVFDMMGRMVKRERYTGQLDVSQLAPGLYTIKADALSARFVKRND